MFTLELWNYGFQKNILTLTEKLGDVYVVVVQSVDGGAQHVIPNDEGDVEVWEPVDWGEARRSGGEVVEMLGGERADVMLLLLLY